MPLARDLSPIREATRPATAGGLLTPGQATFADQLARRTGLDVRVVGAWLLAEESSFAAQGRERSGNHNWLNVAMFDTGPGAITKEKVWKDPVTAANATADFLAGKRWGASTGIRKILGSAQDGPNVQLATIAGSGWASSGYNGGRTLQSLYLQLGRKPIGGAGTTSTSSSSSDSSGGLFAPLFSAATKGLLWVALILGGAVMVGLGVSRAAGAGKARA